MQLPVVADGVVLDRLLPDDAEALSRSHSDPETARFQEWETPLSRQQAVAFIADAGGQPLLPGSHGQLAVREARGGPLAGDLYLGRAADRPWEVEVGITLVAAYTGRGLASAAVRLALDAAFGLAADPVGIHRAIAVVDVDNQRSRRLFERLGFRREGRLVLSGRRRDGSFADELLFAIVNRREPDSGTSDPDGGRG